MIINFLIINIKIVKKNQFKKIDLLIYYYNYIIKPNMPEKLNEYESSLRPIGLRMKEYEEQSSSVKSVHPYESFIIRLDGNTFSRFTGGLKKPFDDIFMHAMVKTCEDLVLWSDATTGYTHSDEITLIYKPFCTEEEYKEDPTKYCHRYNGRVQKLCSLTASLCSVMFNKHINNEYNNLSEEDQATMTKSRRARWRRWSPSTQTTTLVRSRSYSSTMVDALQRMSAIFDARLVIFRNTEKQTEIVNHMIWRSVFDCNRNAISTYADSIIGKKQSMGMNSDEKICKMDALHHESDAWTWGRDVPIYYKHGVYVKREQYTKSTTFTHKKTGEIITTETERTRLARLCFKIDDFQKETSPEYVQEFLLAWKTNDYYAKLKADDFDKIPQTCFELN